MKFSIITPNYNGGRFLPNCIKSVLEQEGEFEHIIVDGGSTDNSINIIGEYPHLLAVSGQDRGMYDAINKGLMLAKGEVISYLNADDRYPTSTFSIVKKALNDNHTADYVYGGCIYIDKMENELYTYKPPPLPKFIMSRISRVPWAQPATFWKREVFSRVGQFDPSFRYAGDYDFFVRLFAEDLIGLRLKECLAKFMLHEGALSVLGEAKMFDELISIKIKNKLKVSLFYDVLFEVVFKLYNLSSIYKKLSQRESSSLVGR